MYKEGSPETHCLMHHGRMLSWVWVRRRHTSGSISFCWTGIYQTGRPRMTRFMAPFMAPIMRTAAGYWSATRFLGLRRHPTITGGNPDRGRTSWLVPHHLRGDGFFLDAGDNPQLDASPSANGQTTGTHSTLVCRTGYADRQILRSQNPRGSRPGNRPAVGVSLSRGLGKENDGSFSKQGTLSGASSL